MTSSANSPSFLPTPATRRTNSQGYRPSTGVRPAQEHSPGSAGNASSVRASDFNFFFFFAVAACSLAVLPFCRTGVGLQIDARNVQGR